MGGASCLSDLAHIVPQASEKSKSVLCQILLFVKKRELNCDFYEIFCAFSGTISVLTKKYTGYGGGVPDDRRKIPGAAA
jgi:hypothetical protein